MDALKHAQNQFCAAVASGDVVAKALANNGFLTITGDMEGNIYLRSSFHRLLNDHARISMIFYGVDSVVETGDAADQHDAMIDAIVARHPERVAKLVEEH
ncbi:FCD domain-containing protein [Sulfitobacter sp.]|uniref:FCD domain-containing protein n=1 Tax=Sulfitobacter sp. TaxID=1903071 RepID=UPI003FCCB5CE